MYERNLHWKNKNRSLRQGIRSLQCYFCSLTYYITRQLQDLIRLNQVETCSQNIPLSFETSPMATMTFFSIIISLLFLAQGGIAQQQDPLPVQLPQVAIEGRNGGTCPSAEVAEQARNSTKEEIRSILRDTVVPILDPTGRSSLLLREHVLEAPLVAAQRHSRQIACLIHECAEE